MFAIDGVKLPGNASKARSGTHAELAHQAQAIERRVKSMLKEHRKQDARGEQGDGECSSRLVRTKALKAEAKAIRAFLQSNAKRQSDKGPERKSNLTDNQSAKMATSKGCDPGLYGCDDGRCRTPDHCCGASPRLRLGAKSARADGRASPPVFHRPDADHGGRGLSQRGQSQSA